MAFLVLLPSLHAQPNTFQAIIAVNDSCTIAMFSYECGKLNWMSDETVIGYSTALDEFEMVASVDVNELSCSNIPVVWTNRIYTIGSVGNDLIHGQISYTIRVWFINTSIIQVHSPLAKLLTSNNPLHQSR